MRRPRSIRSRLVLAVAGGIGALLTLAGLTLEGAVARWLAVEFDAALEAEARALVTLTQQRRGKVELDFADEFMPQFESRSDPHYFELWLLPDEQLERSRSFEASDRTHAAGLPRTPEALATEARFADVVLPDGRAGRLVRLDFVPQVLDRALRERYGETALDPRSLPPEAGLRGATLLVARERESFVARRARLARSLALATLAAIALSVVLVGIGLRLGLAPLARLATEVQTLDERSLARRIELGRTPTELLPVASQLNALLDRLDEAFARERRLSADMAHELKTPVAELRALCEVGLRSTHDEAAVGEFFTDARDIALQMERVVTDLLVVARYEATREPRRLQPVELAEAVAAAWATLAQEAVRRGLDLSSEIPPGAFVDSEPELLGRVLGNLLENAVSYAAPGTSIRCSLERSAAGRTLTLANRAVDLAPGDLQRMFEPFWRKDPSRSGGAHAGLGLPIARSLAATLGIEVAAELGEDGTLRARLTWPGEPPPSSAVPQVGRLG